tara:strand:+ start:1350 stop:4286 length:2937 start_codon:yes stop_codon:yes gene_type:complete
MKWLGQYIQDLPSRFRDDVYLEELATTTETSVLVVDSDGKVSKSTTLADDIIEAEIDTLAGLTSFGSAGATTNILAGDIDWYNPVADGNPALNFGFDANERFMLQPFYSGSSLATVFFKSFTASASANMGKFRFTVDEVNILDIDDGGIDLDTGKGISINGANILTDSSGTATLSNIDAGIITLNNLTIDTDRSADDGGDAAEDITAMRVDFDRAVPTSGTHNHNDIGIDLDVTSASLGESTLKGMDINVTGNPAGNSVAYGLLVNVLNADNNYGMLINTTGTHLKLVASADPNDDYATFTVADTGDLTIATIGDGATDSDLTLDADGRIDFQPADGRAVNITSTEESSSTTGGILNLVSDDGAALGDDHLLGRLAFAAAEDSSGTIRSGAKIEAFADAAWSASENGTRLEFHTKDGNNDSELSLTLDSDLLATFAGAVTVTGALTGTLATAAQTNITSLGTLTGLVLDGDKTVSPGDGAVIHVDAHDVTDGDTSTSGTAALYTHVNIEAPRLIATNASVTTTAAASLYINNAPSAGTNQTITNQYALWVDAGLVKFDGALTVGGTITGDVTGNVSGTAATVTGATQPAIESIGTDGDTLAILADQLQMSNATSEMPTIKLTNTTDDDVSSELIFEKLRDDNGVATGQNLGTIWFRGQDAGTNTEDYAYIIGEIDVSSHGQESGQLTLGVANHDGGNGAGLILTGGSEDNEIDVTVGLGANSVVTIPGDIDLAGDIDVDGTLETDALTIGGAAVLAQATASAVGAVELATTAEATTGTDTARAVTAAGVTAHVDDRYQYVFINHFGNAGTSDMSGDDWLFPKDGQSWESYGYDDLTDTVANEATSFTLPRLSQGKGIIVPYDCILEGVYGSMVSSSNARGALALWTFTPAWGVGGSSGVTATRRLYAAGDLAGATSNYTSRPAKITTIGGSVGAGTDTPVALSAGDSILPSLVCPVDGETTNIKCSFTIVLKVKLPDL